MRQHGESPKNPPKVALIIAVLLISIKFLIMDRFSKMTYQWKGYDIRIYVVDVKIEFKQLPKNSFHSYSKICETVKILLK